MSTDDWQVDRLDLDGYLRRLGVPAREPSRAALAELHEAHVRAFTFDNIEVLLDQHPGVTLGDIQAVAGHRLTAERADPGAGDLRPPGRDTSATAPGTRPAATARSTNCCSAAMPVTLARPRQVRHRCAREAIVLGQGLSVTGSRA